MIAYKINVLKHYLGKGNLNRKHNHSLHLGYRENPLKKDYFLLMGICYVN